MSALLAPTIAEPKRIAISENLDFLDLTMANGDQVRLTAARLRGACKCAHCVRARIDGRFPEDFDGIAITEVSPIGGYAINVTFSDGHARGIYPWSYLLELRSA